MGAMGLGRKPGSHVYIWFYSGTLIATLGATVAKERQCGACRWLVLYVFTVVNHVDSLQYHTQVVKAAPPHEVAGNLWNSKVFWVFPKIDRAEE